jgi:hypothetical protein
MAQMFLTIEHVADAVAIFLYHQAHTRADYG